MISRMLAFAALVFSWARGQTTTPSSPLSDGFVSLFDGVSLAGWTNVNGWAGVEGKPDTWSVSNGVIHATGHPTGFLRSARQYENFVLELEWRLLRPGGNSGLFIWSSPVPAAPDNPYAKAVEVQILDEAHTALVAKAGGKTDWFTTDGDVLAVHGMKMTPFPPHDGRMRSFPSEKRAKPSPEWNHYRITALDGTILLAVNGREVSGGTDCAIRKGYLCLASEGSPVEFRNLRLKEWPSTQPKPEQVAPEAR